MKKLLSLLTCVLLLAPGFSWGQSILIENVNIIDVERGELLSKQDVHLQDGLIQSINQHGSSERELPAGTQRLLGSGKYLMPGFIDTHAHIALGPVGGKWEDGLPVFYLTPDSMLMQNSLAQLVHYGVTTARDPGGLTALTVGAKRAVAEGRLLGPELHVAGSVIDTTRFDNLTERVNTEEEIRQAVREQVAAGVDWVKLYTGLTPELIGAAIEEAQQLGVPTVGHLHNTSWSEASELGIDNIVHVIVGNESYLPEAKQTAYEAEAARGLQAAYAWFEMVDLESDKVKDLIRTLAANGTSVDPTLVIFHATFFGDTDLYTSNPALDRYSTAMIENWSTLFNFNLGWTPQDFERAHPAWDKVEQFIKLLHEGGVLLTAGTDTNNPWVLPGDGFHQELVLLRNCGLTNAEVLKIATWNGAKMLGIEDRVGSIAVGKEADLVLLSENPLENMAATRTIEQVIRNGELVKMEEGL